LSDDSDSDFDEDKASEETQPNSDKNQEPSPEVLLKFDLYHQLQRHNIIKKSEYDNLEKKD